MARRTKPLNLHPFVAAYWSAPASGMGQGPSDAILTRWALATHA
jgi:hypothetical protein